MVVILRNPIQLNRITEDPYGLYIQRILKKKSKSKFSIEFQRKTLENLDLEFSNFYRFPWFSKVSKVVILRNPIQLNRIIENP